MRARYLWLLLLAGCTASNWQKQDATTADLDRDYDECRVSAKPDLVIPAIAGAFGAAGVFVGTTYNDTRIRDCLQAKGWTVGPKGGEASESAAAPTTSPAAAGTTAMPSQARAAGAGPVKAAESQTPAARRLRELNQLRDQRLITKDEYDERRRAILGAI